MTYCATVAQISEEDADANRKVVLTETGKLKLGAPRLASALRHWIEANSKNLEISKTCRPT